MYDQDDYVGLDQDVLKTSSRHLLKTYELGNYIRLDQDVLKTSSEDEDKRRLQEVFTKTNVYLGRSLGDSVRNLITTEDIADSF